MPARRSKKSRSRKSPKRQTARRGCSVYIMRRERRTWYARLTLQWEYKIGISTKPEYRRKMIQEDVDGPVAIISKRAFPNKREAERVEQKIHRIFADSNFRQTTKGLGQAGETEWFYMTDMEYACAEFWLWNYHKRRAINQIATAIFLTLFLVIYATSKNTTGNERENNNGRNRSEFYEPWDSSNGQQQPTSSPNDHHARF